MQVNILHQGSFTVELESNGTVTTHVGGACPTSDDISPQCAPDTYMVPEELTEEER